MDNNDGVVTHLEPDILECELKRAVGSITMNKARGSDRIPAELIKTLKDDAVKVLTKYVSKLGNLGSGHRTGKCQFSSQSQRKTMPKNVEATIQLHLFHMLARL